MKTARRVIGVVFIFAGALHFVRPKPYEQMMPPWIPLHRESVLLSGVAEVAGGLALIPDRTARFGCWWLVATLIAVFPANVHMAMAHDDIRWVAKLKLPSWVFWVRLPLQAKLIALIILVTTRSTQGANRF
jgi:uncharacterized membrane protein